MITISKATGGYQIITKHQFFKCENVICKVYEWGLTFERPTLQYRGKTCKCNDAGNYNGAKRIWVGAKDLVTGRFSPSEDSTEDLFIIEF